VTEGIDTDSCGALLGTPILAALDRVTRAAPGQVVSRIALSPDPEQARAVAMWWTTVGRPAEWKAWSVGTMYVRAGAPPLAPRPTDEAQTPQSTLEATRLNEASGAIITADRLPRVLPGNLNLTEALVGLIASAVSPGHDRYSVPIIGPPVDEARSMLKGPTTVSADELTAAAARLLPALQSSLPSLVSVGPHTLTMGEFLVALAHLHRGEATQTRPVRSPDPYAPGGGWGTVR